ncbi:MAG: Hsp20/alpha crystallin family protein [Candidatus Rokuibacteriota bacterium]
MAKATEPEKRQGSPPEAGGARDVQGQGGQQMTRARQGGAQMTAEGRQAMDLARPRSFRRMFEEFDQLFEDLQRQVLGQDLVRWDAGARWMPRMRVHDTGAEVVLTAELPGFEPDEVSIQCTDDVLTIRGEHREADEEGGARAERTFFQQMAIPAGCDVEDIQASYRNGLLTLRLPRTQETVRRIPISTEPSGQGQQEQQRAA